MALGRRLLLRLRLLRLMLVRVEEGVKDRVKDGAKEWGRGRVRVMDRIRLLRALRWRCARGGLREAARRRRTLWCGLIKNSG